MSMHWIMHVTDHHACTCVLRGIQVCHRLTCMWFGVVNCTNLFTLSFECHGFVSRYLLRAMAGVVGFGIFIVSRYLL